MIDRLKDRVVLAGTAALVGFGSLGENVQANTLRQLNLNNSSSRFSKANRQEDLHFTIPSAIAANLRGSYLPLYQQTEGSGDDQPPPNADLGANIGLPDPNKPSQLPPPETRANIEIKDYKFEFLAYPGQGSDDVEKAKQKTNEALSIASDLDPGLASRVERLVAKNANQPRFIGVHRDWYVYGYAVAQSPGQAGAPSNNRCMEVKVLVLDSVKDDTGKVVKPKQMHIVTAVSTECKPKTYGTILDIFVLENAEASYLEYTTPRMSAGAGFSEMDDYVHSDVFNRETDLDVSAKGISWAQKMVKSSASRMGEYGVDISPEISKILNDTEGMNEEQIRQYLKKTNYKLD